MSLRRLPPSHAACDQRRRSGPVALDEPARGLERLLLLASVALAALAFHGILSNYFFTDDFGWLFRIADVGLRRMIADSNGGHLLLVRNAIFYLCFRTFGMQAEGYFALVLLTHLLNTALLFRLIRRLTGSPLLACLGAALWGMAPAHEGTLGWYSVYGQAVAASVVLLVLGDLASRDDTSAAIGWGTAARWAVLLWSASACFGTALGAALVFPVVVWLVVGSSGLTRTAWAALVLLPIAVIAPYVLMQWTTSEAYGVAPALRPLREPYLNLLDPAGWPAIGGMLVALVGYGVTGLLLGSIDPAPAFPGVASGLAITTFVALTMAAFGRSHAPRRRLALGLVLLMLGAYGAVAGARGPIMHLVPSGLAFGATWGRYHYLGMITLSVLLCMALADLSERSGLGGNSTRLALVPVLAGLTIAALRTNRALDHHDVAREQTRQVIDTIRAEIAAAPEGQAVFIQNGAFPPSFLVPLPTGTAFPGTVAVFELFFPEDMVDGRRVRFLTLDPEHVGAVHRGGRIRSLLIANPQPTASPARRDLRLACRASG